MGLPSPDSLSLPQAVTFVMNRCNCSKGDAKKALHQAGRDGHLDASGAIPLSAHPNAKIREAHPARTRESLRPADWDNEINWAASKVGSYFSVTIIRRSIEVWLSPRQEAASDSVECGTELSTKAVPESTPVKPVLRQDIDAKYKDRLSTLLKERGRYPTREEDEEWGRGKGLGRKRVRELRRQFLPLEFRKGGAPKKLPDEKPGGK